MSYSVIVQVAKARLPGLGGAARQALALMADFAADDGTGIRCSIAKLAADNGLDEANLRRSVRQLRQLGWLIDSGKMHRRGTRIYAIPLDRLSPVESDTCRNRPLSEPTGVSDSTGDPLSNLTGQPLSNPTPDPVRGSSQKNQSDSSAGESAGLGEPVSPADKLPETTPQPTSPSCPGSPPAGPLGGEAPPAPALGWAAYGLHAPDSDSEALLARKADAVARIDRLVALEAELLAAGGMQPGDRAAARAALGPQFLEASKQRTARTKLRGAVRYLHLGTTIAAYRNQGAPIQVAPLTHPDGRQGCADAADLERAFGWALAEVTASPYHLGENDAGKRRLLDWLATTPKKLAQWASRGAAAEREARAEVPPAPDQADPSAPSAPTAPGWSPGCDDFDEGAAAAQRAYLERLG